VGGEGRGRGRGRVWSAEGTTPAGPTAAASALRVWKVCVLDGRW